MPKVGFSGQVLPPGCNISLPSRPKFTWKVDDLGLQATFELEIANGLIEVDCELSRALAGAEVLPLFVRAYDIAKTAVDLAAFATGRGLTIVLDTFIDAAGKRMPFAAAEHPSLAAAATAIQPDAREFGELLQMVLAEPKLMMALRDLIEALVLPHRARINCVRAVGILGPLFRPPGSPPEAGWLIIRERLQISKSYFQPLTQSSIAPALDSGSEATSRAWTIMNRLFEYLKRGSQPLPLSEFPLLA